MHSPIENWNVTEITDMSYLFAYMHYCNPDISGWDVSQVIHFVSCVAR